jgi:hypothetical protein
VPSGAERILLRKHLLVAVAATAAIVFAAFGPGLAGAETTPTGTTDTISIQEVNGTLKFVAPKTVTQGDELEIVNETNPKKVGPHTFSLVTKGSVPKTKPARQKCFTPKHICMAIAHWHGVKGEGPPSVNPATAGAEGWSTMGSITKKGDSWFTGEKPGASYSQLVTADPATTKRLYFVCAIHPWMHGSVEVLPAGS